MGARTFLPIINVLTLELLNAHIFRFGLSTYRFAIARLYQRTLLSLRFLCQHSLISMDTILICYFNINARICQRSLLLSRALHWLLGSNYIVLLIIDINKL
jgi:hypothetical protein